VTAPSRAYRRLALWTAAATFLLIVLGGVVRVSDSGLGCGPGGSGIDGWPLCRGDVVPGFKLHTVIEFAHRAVASIVVVELLVLAVWAWRRFRGHRALVRATMAGVVLIVAQALLGAATVENDLDSPLVAAHLGLAMLLLAVVLYVVRATRPDVPAREASPGFRRHALATQALLLGAIVAGGYMAGTERLGASDQHLADGAHHACGTQFPGCNDSFMPYGSSRLVDIHLVHRTFMYLTTIVLIALVIAVVRSRPSPRVRHIAFAIVGVLVLQILVGALNVWISNEYETLILAHLTLATVLWGAVTDLTLQFYRVPEPAAEATPRRAQGAEAVPA
jgi:heme A synthase